MRLMQFIGVKVYGYLDFDVQFHAGVTFLIGVNGSGKTTILRLVEALLAPSFRDLITIPYGEISISFEDKKKLIKITAKKTKKQFELSSSEVEQPLAFQLIDEDQLAVMLSRERRGADIFDEYQVKYSNNETFKYISDINEPVILGLERTYKSINESSKEFYLDLYPEIRRPSSRSLRERGVVHGALAVGLMESQILVQDAYRHCRNIESKKFEIMREKIFTSAFKYYDASIIENIGSIMLNQKERKNILEKKAEIGSTLRKIGLATETNDGLETFFQKLAKLFASNESTKESKGYAIEWIINKAQIDRMLDLIRAIDGHRSSINDIYAPINKFIEIVNFFYNDTGKSIKIDAVGQLIFEKPNKQCTNIEALSSGERQLLIMFAHLIFNKYGNKSNVFIIDEPELSLHLKWQESFVKKAIKANANAQLILATHSPEIIADYEANSVTI